MLAAPEMDSQPDKYMLKVLKSPDYVHELDLFKVSNKEI